MLSYRDSETLAGLLGCDAGELRHETRPKRKPMKRKPRPKPPVSSGPALAAIPEMAVEASAGFGAWNEERATEKASWYLPEGMIRYEGDASPETLRILRVRGNSMEPEEAVQRAGLALDRTVETSETRERMPPPEMEKDPAAKRIEYNLGL